MLSRITATATLALSLLACAVALVGMAAAPALAHTELESSDPGDGDRVTMRLNRVALEFTGEFDREGLAVEVRGPDGPVDVGEPRVRGTTLLQRLDPLTRGRYTIRYQVFALDGHELEDELTFRYAGPEPEPDPEPDPDAKDEEADEAHDADDPSHAASEDAAAAQHASSESAAAPPTSSDATGESSSGGPAITALTVAAVALAAAGLGLLMARGERRKRAAVDQ